MASKYIRMRTGWRCSELRKLNFGAAREGKASANQQTKESSVSGRKERSERAREGAERESTGRGQIGGASGASRASGTSELSNNRERKGKAQELRHHD